MKKGFVDLQCNGWMGTDFSAAGLTAEQVLSITSDLLDRGTIAYCPTLITADQEIYKANMNVILKAMKAPELGGHILGIHLEGPFISPEPGAVGAHPAQHILDPDIKTFDMFQEWAEGNIRILTVAPERPGCEELISHAVSQGVVVSLGHHLAADEDLQRAVKAGAKLCTHVGNGIPNHLHRHENPLWWQLAHDEVSGMFITDGHHLPSDIIKVALRAKTPERFIVTSDASPLAGMPPGNYSIFDGLDVTINSTGRIYAAKTKGMAGSHATMIECMNHLASLELLDENDLWRVGHDNPLSIIGTDLPAEMQGPTVKFEDGLFVIR